jgi:HK97 family phage major capsid protein
MQSGSNQLELKRQLDAASAQMKSLNGRATAIMNRAEAESREMTAAEQKQVNDLGDMVDRLLIDARAIRAELDAAEEARLSTPCARRTTPDPLPGGASWSSNAAPYEGLPVVDAAIPGRGRYEHLFNIARSSRSEFKDLGDFVRAVGSRDSQRLQNAAAGMNENTGADGGWLVPTGFTVDLMNASYDQEVIRPRARSLPLIGREMDAPMFGWTDRTKGPAALIGYWAGEAAELTKQKAKTTKLSFAAKKLTILLPITNELLYDAGPQSDVYIREAMSGTIAAYLDRAFYFGTGAGLPLGILNSAGRVTVPKEGSQTATTINFANVSKMIARLMPSSFANSVWLAHPSTLPQLMKLTIEVKNLAGSDVVGGTVAPIQVAADGSMTLMTRPVIITDLASDLGTEGDLALCDFSGYAVAMQSGMRFAVSEGPGFTTDETYFRVTLRCDGQPILGSTVTPRTGTATLSHFVTLETRG